MQTWNNHEFESSSQTTDEFRKFDRDYKKEMKKLLQGFTLEAWNRGHFYCSSFWKNNETGKYIYISCSDVRSFPNEWCNHILIRTAQHTKDYSGGMNNYATLYNILDVAQKLSI